MGQRFGARVIIAEQPKRKGGRRVRVRCDCGDERSVYLATLRQGTSQACVACSYTSRQKWRNERQRERLRGLVRVAPLPVDRDKRRLTTDGARLAELPTGPWRVIGKWPNAGGQPDRLVDLESVADPSISVLGVPWWAVTPATPRDRAEVRSA